MKSTNQFEIVTVSNPFLDISEEVQKAISNSQPVVVLESMNTLRHGGKNYLECASTAQLCEQSIRRFGAIPATTGIIKGRMKVGLTSEEQEFLASEKSQSRKVSRRDLPFLLGSQYNGFTTVTAAMILADLAGLRIVAAGGLGGVHREGDKTFDISPDLQELTKTDVAVVCSGSKSIIDPELTLEYLETQGVPVIGYQTSTFPQFCVRDSGYVLDYRMDDVSEVAKVLQRKWSAGLRGGVVVANPAPVSSAIETGYMDINISKALTKMKSHGISGQACTSYLLDRVNDMTGGQSLDTNVQLLHHNACLAAELAISYSFTCREFDKKEMSNARFS